MLSREQFGRLLRAATPAVVLVAPAMATADQPAAASSSAVQSYEYHHGDVLGTAMDLTVVAANRADADAAEHAVLAEIDRLKKILSTYDPDSEVSRLNASPVGGVEGMGLKVSPELIDVLQQYDGWSKKTDGAYTGHAGDLVAAWTAAQKANALPDPAALAAAAKRAAAPAWAVNAAAGTVKRIADQQVNVSSLGKGYIIDHAVAAATRDGARLTGLLLNIGGDLRTWGAPSATPGALWSVGVQDPAHPELNAKPMATLFVPGGRSVSTSGAYQRFYTVAGQRYSHILDARTGKPTKTPSATVVANDSATANALATICCVVRFGEAFEFVRAVPGAEGMIVTPDDVPMRTDGFKELQDKAAATAQFAPRLPVQFPAGYKLTVDLETVQTQRRPYVFIWVTDQAGRHVKTLGGWGNEARWMADMHQWWKFAQKDKSLRAVSHATQQARKYPVMWDGTDQKGGGVRLGTYNLWVEASAEHGPYGVKFATIDLANGPATATVPASPAFNACTVTYGPGGATR